jgi:hypothetical protein
MPTATPLYLFDNNPKQVADDNSLLDRQRGAGLRQEHHGLHLLLAGIAFPVGKAAAAIRYGVVDG